jgi:hypothetical protein
MTTARPPAWASRAAEALLSGGRGPVTRREAEALWDLATAAEGRADRAQVEALFVAGVASHLLSQSTAANAACAGTLSRAPWVALAHSPVDTLNAAFARILTAVLSEDAVCAEEGWAPRAAAELELHELAAGIPAQNWIVERLSRAPAASAEARLSAFLGDLAKPRPMGMARAA